MPDTFNIVNRVKAVKLKALTVKGAESIVYILKEEKQSSRLKTS